MSDNLKSKVTENVAFLKFISSAEVALKNSECSHAKYLSLKNKLEKNYQDLWDLNKEHIIC